MIGRLSGSVPATKESPLATSKAMVVLNDVTKIGKISHLEWNVAQMECSMNGIKLGPQPVLSHC